MTAAAVGRAPAIHQEALPKSRVVGYGMGDAACNIAFQMTGLFLLVFYTEVVGINPIHAGNIFLFVKIWDAFADLFAGRIVDRTMTKWGKFRPFLLWYSVPLLASNLLCFWIPVDGYGAKLAWATASYALMGLLYSLVNIPFGSLAGAMTQDTVGRSRLASARMIGSGATIVILSVFLAPQIKASQNLGQTFLITAAIFGVVGAALFFTTFATSKEVVQRDVEHVTFKQAFDTLRQNKPLIMLCCSAIFFLTSLSMVGALAIYVANTVLAQLYSGSPTWLSTLALLCTSGVVLVVAPFTPRLVRRFGKKRTFMAGGLTGVVGGVLLTTGYTVFRSFAVCVVALLLLGIGMALLNTVTWALEADTVEYGEMKTGIRTEGATYATFSFTRKCGQAIGAALASYALGIVGYVKGPHQSPEVLNGIAVAAGLVPAAIYLIAVIIMAFYPLDENSHGEAMRIIEERRSANGTALTGTTTPAA
jgi:glucuronide carrier protein